MQAYLRWRNANARHPDVLTAQRREHPDPQRTPTPLGPTSQRGMTEPGERSDHRTSRAPEIRRQYRARDSGISSALLVQMNGRGCSFQSAIQALMSISSFCTLLWTRRRIIWSARNPNHR
jgi:hypothetical protein